jgi:hemoglobin-like flavoprotein
MQAAGILRLTLARESTMTPSQIETVRSTFAQLAPVAPQAAALFYHHLFEADPKLRHLFTGDMLQQGDRLMTMIGTAVRMLDQPAALLPVLRSLGGRHATYGVTTSHYDTVGGALLKTLSQGLGSAWNADAEEAWTRVYGVIRGTMLEGAKATATA